MLIWPGPAPYSRTTWAIQAAEAGQGFALADQIIATDALLAGRLVRPFDIETRDDEGYWLVWGKGLKLNASGLAFRQWLVAEMHKTNAAYEKLKSQGKTRT